MERGGWGIAKRCPRGRPLLVLATVCLVGITTYFIVIAN